MKKLRVDIWCGNCGEHPEEDVDTGVVDCPVCSKFKPRDTPIDYRSDHGVSRSDLLGFSFSRKLFRAAKGGLMDVPPEMRPPSKMDALNIGTATHMWLLEKHRIEEEIAVFDGTRHPKSKAWIEFQEKNQGRTILTTKQWWLVLVMHAVVTHEIGDVLSASAMREKAIYWDEMVQDGTVIRCRTLLDVVTPMSGKAIILDVKTDKHQDVRGHMERSIRERSYWLQDAFYSLSVMRRYGYSMDEVDFLFAAVSKPICEAIASCMLAKAPPHLSVKENYEELLAHIMPSVREVAPAAFCLTRIGASDRERAFEKTMAYVEDYASCVVSGEWLDEGAGKIQTVTGVVPNVR